MAMNNIKSFSNGSILELPTEIFHLIFDYLDCQTIIQSIGLVCNQFQEIVDSYNRLKLNLSHPSECQLKSLSQLIQTKNILSISLSYRYREEPSQVNFLFSSFRFDEFVHLKSLRLTQIDDEQFDEFFQNIRQYRLKSLSIIFLDQTTKQIEEKFNIISSMIVSCGLEQLSLNISNKMFMNDTTWKSIQSVLKHLTIYYCTIEEYHQILSSCENLKALTIRAFSYTKTSISSISSNLTTLMLDGRSLSLKPLFEALSSTSNLLHLRMNIWNFERSEIICGQSLEKFIHNQLSYLKRFEFSFSCNGHHCSLQSIIESFQTPFWLNEKRWIVHCDYVFESSIMVLHTASLKINKDKNVVRCTNFCSNDDQLQLIVQDRLNSSYHEGVLLDDRRIKLNDVGALFLIDIFNKNTMLTTLTCENKSMSLNYISHLANAIETNETLTTLDYQCRRKEIIQYSSSMNMHDESCSSFSSRRFQGRTHHRDDDSTNCFGSSHPRYSVYFAEGELIKRPLFSGSKNFDQYKSIDIRSDEEVQYITNALIKNKTLKVLRLRCDAMSTREAKHLAHALKMNSTLITLDCGQNHLTYEEAQYLADALKINSTLTTLILSSNGLESMGIKHLAEALQINMTLTTIDLRGNRIDSLGAQYLAKMLRTNKKLRTLILENNSIEDQGTQDLAKALRVNKILKTLSLSKNNIGRSSAEHLLKTFDKNQTIISLELENNPRIDQYLLDRIDRSIQRNREYLSFCSN